MRLRPCWFLTASNLNPNLIFRYREKKEGDFGRVFLFVWLMYYIYGQSLNHFIHQSSRFYVLTPRRLYVPGRAQVGHKFSVLKIKIERSVKWIKWKTPLRQKPDSCVWFFFLQPQLLRKYPPSRKCEIYWYHFEMSAGAQLHCQTCHRFFRRSLVEQFISLNQSASALCGCFSSTSVEACRNCFEIFDSVSLSAVRSERFACSFRPALFFRAWCGISTNWSSSLMWLSLLNCNYTGLLSSSRQKWAQVQTDAHHPNVSLPLKLS